jgi:RHS repeat-associated protein
MPFGETFVSQKAQHLEHPYQFSAKEKDDETGFSYFGARYYNSDVSVWLSVDPLSDKYPSMSPIHVLRRQSGDAGGSGWEDKFREYGGIFGTDATGQEKVIWAKPGETADPSKVSAATIDMFDAADPSEKGTLKTYAGTFHSHPSGTVTVGNNPSPNSGSTIGGSSTVYSFDQPPSTADIKKAIARTFVTGNNYVLGMGSKTVYIYNGSGVIATFPLNLFGSVGK